MEKLDIKQSTQFKIKELNLVTKFGTHDLSGIFNELNLYDSVLIPCCSGNILVTDSLGLSKKLVFDGSEYLQVNIGKDDSEGITNHKKTYRIYKQSNRKNINQTSEAYVLHFISEEYVYSLQQKVGQYFEGTYAEMAEIILSKYLKIPGDKLGNIDSTSGVHQVVSPRESPIDTLSWLAKRSVNNNNVADYLFFENRAGYNFMSLGSMYSHGPLFSINFDVKNQKNGEAQEFLGVREFNFHSQFDVLDNIRNGFFANKFIGYDILIRKYEELDFDINYHYKGSNHLNNKPNAFVNDNREGKDVSQMYESKINMAPFQFYRKNDEFVSYNDGNATEIVDNTHAYIPQRKAILHNLVQKKLTISLPGNFVLSSGYVLNVESKTFGAADSQSENVDKSTSGNYLIIGTRHIITPQKHTTMCELASDSTNNGLFLSNSSNIKSAMGK